MTCEEAKAQLIGNNRKGGLPLLAEIFKKLPPHQLLRLAKPNLKD